MTIAELLPQLAKNVAEPLSRIEKIKSMKDEDASLDEISQQLHDIEAERFARAKIRLDRSRPLR